MGYSPPRTLPPFPSLPPSLSLSSSLSLSVFLSWLSCHSVFYKPHSQSLGYKPVTLATSLASHLLSTHSHVATWPPVLHLIGCCVLVTSIFMLLVRNEVPSHFHTFTPFSIFASSLSLLWTRASSPTHASCSHTVNAGIVLHQHSATVTAWIHIWYFLFDGLYQMKTQDLHWHFTEKELEILPLSPD